MQKVIQQKQKRQHNIPSQSGSYIDTVVPSLVNKDHNINRYDKSNNNNSSSNNSSNSNSLTVVSTSNIMTINRDVQMENVSSSTGHSASHSSVFMSPPPRGLHRHPQHSVHSPDADGAVMDTPVDMQGKYGCSRLFGDIPSPE